LGEQKVVGCFTVANMVRGTLRIRCEMRALAAAAQALT
jgi:hypothetical protein